MVFKMAHFHKSTGPRWVKATGRSDAGTLWRCLHSVWVMSIGPNVWYEVVPLITCCSVLTWTVRRSGLSTQGRIQGIVIWNYRDLYNGFVYYVLFSRLVYQHGITLIPAWISNHRLTTVWGENTYPFPNFNGSTVEVWEGISNLIPRFIMDVITYPYCDYTAKYER